MIYIYSCSRLLKFLKSKFLVSFNMPFSLSQHLSCDYWPCHHNLLSLFMTNMTNCYIFIYLSFLLTLFNFLFPRSCAYNFNSTAPMIALHLLLLITSSVFISTLFIIKEVMNMPDLAVQALALTIRHLKEFGFERILCSGASIRPFSSNTEMTLSANALQQLEVIINFAFLENV